MTRPSVTINDVRQIHNRALDAINEMRLIEAIDLSEELTRKLQLLNVRPIIEGDGRTRRYSILVIAYKPAPEHAELLDYLLALDPDRFELVLVENASSPVFPFPKGAAIPNLKLLRLEQNLGIGIARHLGFLAASGEGVICIDDDGLTTPEAINSLVSTFEQHQAVAVRGRVLPRMPGSDVPAHYDLGNGVKCRHCDIEGMAIWDRQEVMRVGGFDPILYGHEGTDLTARLYPSHGPEAFLYDSNAVLWHDYAISPDKLKEKRARYERLNRYLKVKSPDCHKIRNVFRELEHSLVSDALVHTRRSYATTTEHQAHTPRKSVSLLTTCRNGEEFIEDFVASLDRQSDRDFELVFVDDGSEDNSIAMLQRRWPGDIPIRIVQTANIGRAASLNRAVEEASGDICLIADVDDISIPQRVEWTRESYRRYPEADMIGFMIFDKRSQARAASPLPIGSMPLEVRCLFVPGILVPTRAHANTIQRRAQGRYRLRLDVPIRPGGWRAGRDGAA